MPLTLITFPYYYGKSMKIAGYLRTSLLEWPGKISSVLFTPGCNFRCSFCHNADLARNVGLQEISEQSVLKDLKSRKKWIDGIAITGGEPTLQPDLPELVARLKQLGFGIMLETNGSLPQNLQKTLPFLDYLSLDFKTKLENYSQVVKKQFDVQNWRQSLDLIITSGLPFELRTTIVPTIHDQQILLAMAKFLNSLFTIHDSSFTPAWFWQSFVPQNCLDKTFLKINPYSLSELETFALLAKKSYSRIKIKGSSF